MRESKQNKGSHDLIVILHDIDFIIIHIHCENFIHNCYGFGCENVVSACLRIQLRLFRNRLMMREKERELLYFDFKFEL